MLIILFHIGSSTGIAQDIVTRHATIFNSPTTYVFVSVHDEASKNITQTLFPPNNATISTIDNKGCDIGGFMHNLHAFRTSSLYNKSTAIAIVHTKSDSSWRDEMIDSIFINLESNVNYITRKQEQPVILGSNKYRFPLCKFVNIELLPSIVASHPNISPRIDLEYVDKCDMSLKPHLKFDSSFYYHYEPDMRANNIPLERVYSHWQSSGHREYHRVPNANVITKPHTKSGFFIAGTIFMCNRAYLDLLSPINLLVEATQLESGYIQQVTPRRTHFWEYFHGLLAYSNNGLVTGITKNMGYIENVDADLFKTLKKRGTIASPVAPGRVYGVFTLSVYDTLCGGYRTILSYVNDLLTRDPTLVIDMYHDNHANIDNDIEKMIIEQYNEISSENWKRLNLFSGLICQRAKTYDVLMATAWQTARACLAERANAKRLVYLIQDEEHNFYPNNPAAAAAAKATYSLLEFEKYCLSAYLSNAMRQYGESRIVSGFIGCDTSIYRMETPYRAREDAVAIVYFAQKATRCPETVEGFVRALAAANITTYVFPTKISEYDAPSHVKYVGTLTPVQLNTLYNKCKVGICLSGTNHSRLSVEMLASGMEVIELDNMCTSLDLPSSIYNKVQQTIASSALVLLVRKLFEQTNPCKMEQRDEFIGVRSLTNERLQFVEFIKDDGASPLLHRNKKNNKLL